MTFGLFEASLGSETEVGMARQASTDKLNTAVYDVREKLGGFLFQAESLEDFRDRVAMTKNDQSLFKIIEASGMHPATGIVRRIAGRNSILEEEFKQRLAISDPDAPGRPDAIVNDDVLPTVKGDQTQMTMDPNGNRWGNRRQGTHPDDYDKDEDESEREYAENPAPGSSNEFYSKGRKADFEGVQDIDSTFSHDEQGKELKPKDNWEGYLNSVDQDAPSKVKRNFASKESWRLYLAWCTSNNKSAARLSSLDAYASNLSDVQYLKLANTLQAANDDDDWGSDHHPKTPNTNLKKTDKVAVRGYEDDFQPAPDSGVPAKNPQGPQAHSDLDVWELGAPYGQHAKDHGNPEWGDKEEHWGNSPGMAVNHPTKVKPGGGRHEAMRRYVAWCDRNGYSKVAKSTIDHYAADKPRLRKHLYSQVATTIRWAKAQHVACWPGCHENEAHVKKVHKDKEASRRTAAPDYLQKADDALTQLLNQKAEEFQQTIQPLQQALQTVQQAEQLQQQANPMNVLPPAGTVNVMPGGDPSTASQVGMPDPNAQDTSGLAALLSGVGGTAPNDAPMGGGQDAPPPAAAGGGLPPDMDPNQPQQMAASRKRRRQARGVGDKFDAWKGKKTQQGDLLRGGDPDYEQFANETGVGERALNKLKQRNQTPDFAPINRSDLQGVTVGSRKRAYQDDDGYGGDTTDDFYAPAPGSPQAEYKHPGQDHGWSHSYDREQHEPYTGEHYSKGSAQVHGGPGPDGDQYHLHTPHGKTGPYQHPEHAMKAAEPYLQQQKEISGGQGTLASRRTPRKKVRGGASPQHRGMRKGAPFAGYDDFADCTSKNSDKDRPDAYCGEIKHRTEDKRQGRRKRAGDPNQPFPPEQADPNSPIDGPQNHAPLQGGQEIQLRQQQANRKQAWSGWGPAQFPKARKVAGWDWDDGLQAYLASSPRQFTCGCGQEHQTPNGYQRCKCGKAYNSYVIGTGGSNKEAAAEKFLVREIPVRPDVIVGATQGTPRRKVIRAQVKPVVQLVDPRTGNIHKLIDPGELDDGEDPGHSTFKTPPSDWAKRGDGAKWIKKPIG